MKHFAARSDPDPAGLGGLAVLRLHSQGAGQFERHPRTSLALPDPAVPDPGWRRRFRPATLDLHRDASSAAEQMLVPGAVVHFHAAPAREEPRWRIEGSRSASADRHPSVAAFGRLAPDSRPGVLRQVRAAFAALATQAIQALAPGLPRRTL